MITLYSTNCPRCNILKTKLDNKGIEYTEENSVDKMLALGIESAPVLEVDNKILDFFEAIKWVGKE